MRAQDGDGVGCALPTLTLLKERACQCTNGKSERTLDGRGASFSSHLTQSRPRLFSSLHKVPGD